jgi:hypothetical protein
MQAHSGFKAVTSLSVALQVRVVLRELQKRARLNRPLLLAALAAVGATYYVATSTAL